MDTLFISDLHLSPDRPERLRLFMTLLQGPALAARALYVLGDLFEEFWVGTDDRTPPHSDVLAALRRFTDGGGRGFIVRGNRDLLLDGRIEPITGCTLLPDWSVIEVDGHRVLIGHGDLLCTGDRGYQAFRAFMETSAVRQIFSHMPCGLRMGLAHSLRPLMRRTTRSKAPEITDVDPAEVIRVMREHDVTDLVHGHTHRPAVHTLDLDGRPARRTVLGDWYGDPLMLVCTPGAHNLIPVRDYLAAASPPGTPG